jgi:Arc/MetJ family transcription regulator
MITKPYSAGALEGSDNEMVKLCVNIEIEEDFVERIMRRYGVGTITEAVDLALRKIAVEPMTREGALALEGSCLIDQIPPDQPPRGSAW